MTTEDYATPQRLAMYLESGWSDFLLTPPGETSALPDKIRPLLVGEVGKPTFFQEVASLARNWSYAISLNVSRVCDIEGGTGRTIFELDRQFPKLSNLTLVEPSLTFCN